MGKNSLLGFGKFLANAACILGCKKRPNKLLSALSFGSYLKRIKGAKTTYDWLSTDPEVVQKFIDDPLCKFYFTSDGFRTLFNLIGFMQSKEAYANVPADRPCLFAYSTEDPVGSYAAGVEKVIEKMKASGADLKAINYGPYRHELMNEPAIKEQYFKDLVDFYDALPLA